MKELLPIDRAVLVLAAFFFLGGLWMVIWPQEGAYPVNARGKGTNLNYTLSINAGKARAAGCGSMLAGTALTAMVVAPVMMKDGR